MSPPPRPPTPADLARARPRVASPPGSRGRADVEKERAQRALRALAADPDTDFAALPADEFFAVLKYACRGDAVSPALMAEAGRRIAAWESGPRELHQVLLVSGDHEAWAEVAA